MLPNKLTTIKYSKVLEEDETGVTSEITERSIIPITVPGNIKALDVTDHDLDIQYQLSRSYEEYAEYLRGHVKLAFSFENWLSHTKSVDFTPKYRTFKPEQTTELATPPEDLVTS